MPDTLPLATVKNRFSEIIDQVNREHDRVVVTRDGVPAAVLIPLFVSAISALQGRDSERRAGMAAGGDALRSLTLGSSVERCTRK